MYRVLLVDDEESVLKVLKTSIDWLALGVDTPVTAADGVQALEAMERSPFHLLIADIKMPRMGGLELIRRVRQLYPETRCILLTAYSEFDYAKEAIRLGVENYLLKPVQKEELESTVQNAMANLYSHRGNGGNLLYENILHRWLAGAISGEELSERAGVLGLNLFLPQYCAVGILKRRQDSSTALFRSACLEQLGRQYEVYHCWNERGIFVLILGGRLLGRMELEHQLRALAGQLDAAVHALVAVGSAVTDPQALHLSYSMVCDMAELADPAQPDVILSLQADTHSLDADSLIEDLRSFCYGAPGAKDSHALASQLYWSVPYKDAASCLQHLLYAYLRVKSGEFPGSENVQEQLPEHFMSRLSAASGEEAAHLLAVALDWMRAGSINQMAADLQQMIARVYDYELRRKEAELQELQAKFNPHFLYNTLEIFRARCYENGDEETAELIAQTAANFRGLIGSRNFIPMQEELSASKRYIALGRARHDDGVEVQYDIDTGVLQYGIIRNVFQPLIENYFEHGYDSGNAEENFIHIRGRLAADGLILFEVEDNGYGMDPARMAQMNERLQAPIRTEQESYGLKNLHQRLRLFYGEPCGLTLCPRAEGRGLRIEVRVRQMKCEDAAQPSAPPAP